MYGIKKAAELTGTSPITLRAWENRYDVIKPMRTEGGTRIYSEENIEDLLWVIQEKEENKVSIKEAMRLLKEKKMNVFSKEPEKQTLTVTEADHFHEEIYELLKKYDTKEATSILERAIETYDYEDFFHQVYVPMLFHVGKDWENNNLSVAKEHFISHYIQRKIYQYFNELEADTNNPSVLAICPPYEMHHIGLILFSLFLKRRGYPVLFIGENTPKEELEDVLEENHVKLMCLSVTMPAHVNEVEEMIEYIKEHYKEPLEFIIGGNSARYLPSHLIRYQLSGGLKQWTEWLEKSTLKQEV